MTVPSYRLLILSLFFLIQSISGSPRIDPLVDTKLGLVRGLKASDGDYAMFLGVPYGKVNESNPFGVSAPYPEFEDVYDAYEDFASCPQLESTGSMYQSYGSTLDCLRLNIYVPSSASSRNRLPVMVYVHGGAFSGGSGQDVGPKYIVRHGVVLVSINYRLGPYGFMCLDIPEIPGNQGLKDQLLAFRWIKDNIESFGGDSRKISIFGGSAGGMSTDLHLASNSEKLFSKAIVQSGNSLSPVFYEPIKDAPIGLAKQLGFATEDLNEALTFLASVDADLVIAAVSELGYNFTPCIEKEFDNVESFLTEDWIKSGRSKVKNMPILIGFNSDESFMDYYKDEEFFGNIKSKIEDKLAFGFDIRSEKFNEIVNDVKKFYIGDDTVDEDVRLGWVYFDSDWTFNYPTERSVDKYNQNGAGDVYYYVLSYVGDMVSSRRGINGTQFGAGHGDEGNYLFDASSKYGDPTPKDQLAIDRLTTLWSNFVKYGDPTPETSELLPVKWKPNTNGSLRYYLNIDSELSLQTRPLHQRLVFWDLVYKAHEEQVICPSCGGWRK